MKDSLGSQWWFWGLEGTRAPGEDPCRTTASLLLGEYTLISTVSDPDSVGSALVREDIACIGLTVILCIITKPKFYLGNPCSLKIGVGMVGRGAPKEETSSLNLWVTSFS